MDAEVIRPLRQRGAKRKLESDSSPKIEGGNYGHFFPRVFWQHLLARRTSGGNKQCRPHFSQGQRGELRPIFSGGVLATTQSKGALALLARFVRDCALENLVAHPLISWSGSGSAGGPVRNIRPFRLHNPWKCPEFTSLPYGLADGMDGYLYNVAFSNTSILSYKC